MRRLSLFLFLTLISVSTFAQKKGKPKLIIYGQGEAALASAIQSSNSGVNTIWINPDATFKSALTEGSDIKKVNSYHNIDAGLWAEFLKKSLNTKDYTDSVFQHSKAYLNPRISINTFEKMLDSATNLTVINKVEISKIKKSGKKWQVDLSNGENYKVFAILDASAESKLLSLVSKEDQLPNPQAEPSTLIETDKLYTSDLYRTSLFVADNRVESIVPTSALIKPFADNVFAIYGPKGVVDDIDGSVDNVPTKILYGQALGAIASYCAFFEIKSDKINIRTLQGELMSYKAQPLPFHDVTFEDIHNGSIQRIGLTGLFQGRMSSIDGKANRLIFDVDSHVSSMEIEPTMKSLYTRSQIWFADKKIEDLKLKDLMDMIKFVALKGNELDVAVEKGWTKKFNFAGSYDPECFVTRRQAAVLIDTYLQPFNVKVDLKGSFRY